MQVLNITGYQFISLTGLPSLQAFFTEHCQSLQLKGTILLSHEGININLSGEPQNILQFKQILRAEEIFSSITFRESYSSVLAFKRLKIKIKNEIITMRRPEIHPEIERATSISPEQFKQWLDENRDITVLDTRNEYEITFGTFQNALNLHINDFSEFPHAAKNITKNKPVVMFCTGGIRCEKAGLHLLNMGFTEVYQLEGGILNYFTKMGNAHYDGECFVFDDRVALKANIPKTDDGN